MKQTIIFITFLLFSSASVMLSSCKEKRGELKPIRYIGSYTRDFGDLNDLHLSAAQKKGVKPVQMAGDVFDDLEEIKSCDAYELQKLTHSSPYLIADASTLLEEIGQSFQDSLRALNAPDYKILVTSVFRSETDIKKLKRRNSNASDNSAHRFATTFDISWARYIKVDPSDTLELKPEQLKMVLAAVLRDLKKRDRCYIKHERKQGCFHITVR